MNSYIFLDNVRFFAYHGVGEQEREVGNEFVINLKLKVDIARAAETDDVTHTVSYADVYENVTCEPSYLCHPAGASRCSDYNSPEAARTYFRKDHTDLFGGTFQHHCA